MTFAYGVESFSSCGWHIPDEATYEFLAAVIRRDLNWNCRMPMVPDVPEGHDWYVPFTMQVWGVVEQDHMHIGTDLGSHAQTHSDQWLPCLTICTHAFTPRTLLQTTTSTSSSTRRRDAFWVRPPTL
jgi:hypothetical protein